MSEIKFGTDGWRAIIGREFTFKNVKIVAQAIADYVIKIEKRKKPSIVIGYDARFLSDRFADAIAGVLTANGIRVSLSKNICTTPMISFIVKRDKHAGGVMVTASHNPYDYNGIKYKAHYGGPADEDIIGRITKQLFKRKPKEMTLEQASVKGLMKRIDYHARYMRFLRSYINAKVLKRKKFNVIVDNMYGAGSTYLEEALGETACKVTTLHNIRNPFFGGVSPEPIAKNLGELIRRVKRERADIGLAVDGDVDRIGAVTTDGTYYSTQTIIPLLAEHMLKNRDMRGGIATTISGSTLIRKVAERHHVPFYETPVGFKHICALMRTKDILIGGEESGGVGFKKYIPERDGVLSGVLLLEMMAYEGKSFGGLIKDLFKSYGVFLQQRVDTPIPEAIKKRLYSKIKGRPPSKVGSFSVESMQTYDGIKLNLADDRHLLLRLSGTEPILRIYAEAHSEKELSNIIRFGKSLIQKV